MCRLWREDFGWWSGCEVFLHGSAHNPRLPPVLVLSKSQQVNLGHFRCHHAVRHGTYKFTSRHGVRHAEDLILSSPFF